MIRGHAQVGSAGPERIGHICWQVERKMNVKRRWMKWVFEEVENFDVVMPWERGAKPSRWKRNLSEGASLRKVANG